MEATAQERTAPAAPVRPAELVHYSLEQLDGLFAALPAPAVDEVQGAYRGRLLAAQGIDLLPEPIRARLLIVLQTKLFPWRGKSFSGGEGANLWLRDEGGVPLVRYRVHEADALEGGGRVVQLDYDVRSNPAPLRRILGEARRLGDNLYLARMNYRLGPKTVRILYFTLEK